MGGWSGANEGAGRPNVEASPPFESSCMWRISADNRGARGTQSCVMISPRRLRWVGNEQEIPPWYHELVCDPHCPPVDGVWYFWCFHLARQFLRLISISSFTRYSQRPISELPISEKHPRLSRKRGFPGTHIVCSRLGLRSQVFQMTAETAPSFFLFFETRSW